MASVSRRTFLKRSSAALAAAGALSAVPLLADSGRSPAKRQSALGALNGGSTSDPLVAHLRDPSTGEINLYSGTESRTVHDPELAARLFNLTGR